MSDFLQNHLPLLRADRELAPLRYQSDLLEARAHLLLGHAALERAEASGIVDRDLLELRRDSASLQVR